MRSLLYLGVLVCLALAGCGNQQSDRRNAAETRLHASAIYPRQIVGGNEFLIDPQRPARPERAPESDPPPPPPPPDPTLWAADVRVNSLVSNHGVGTAGEPGIAVVPDFSGGSFLFWEDAALGVIRTQHVDGAGKVLWDGGVVTTSPAYQASPSAISNGDGTMLVAWIDGHNGGCDSTIQMLCEIFIQKLDANGSRLWGDDGLPVTNSARFPVANRFAMTGDGAGGAYLAWTSGQDFYRCCSYYMQHVGSNGNPLWTLNGMRATELPTVLSGPGLTGPRLLADGAGGVILAWWNQQAMDGSVHLMTQRFDSLGNMLWDSAGVEVTFTGVGHPNFDSVSDGAGGVILAVQSNDVQASASTHIYVQRISAAGEVMWAAGGVQVSSQIGAQTSPALAADEQGGAFVAWSLFDSASKKNNRVSVMHVDGTGKPVWPFGIAVTQTAVGQLYPRLLGDPRGVMVAWEDCRLVSSGDCSTGYDLYAQWIGPTGEREWGVDGFPISVAQGNQGVDYGDERRPGFEMLSDGAGGVTFVWPDGRLKLCSTAFAGWCELYAQHLQP